jgi:GTPase
MALPVVVIVGRPNVGKSSLLNALARRRISIVDPRSGVTRDRVSAVIAHEGHHFELVDTGGVGIVDADHLEADVEQQIEYAIARADLVLFLVDVRDGLTPLDRTVAERLRGLQLTLPQPLPRREGSPERASSALQSSANHSSVLLVANKLDAEPLVPDTGEFVALGFGEPLPVSAHEGFGRRELLDRIVLLLGEPSNVKRPPEPVMKLAIVGKRNAGKSTLVNALAGTDRMIVSETPGTTRDAVDVRFERDGRTFMAIDTAGVRKSRQMQDLEFYSYSRALRSIRRADVVLHLIDATVPVSEVDLKLSRAIMDEFKPVILAVNKWDLVGGRADHAAFASYLAQVMPAVDFAPIVFITAKTGHNVSAAVDLALSLHKQASTRVTTGPLNAALQRILELRGPSAKHGTKAVKLYYGTQVSTSPPTIVFFCNDPELVRDDYRRFMENRLRELLPFKEVPMRLMFRARQREQATTAGGARRSPTAKKLGARPAQASQASKAGGASVGDDAPQVAPRKSARPKRPAARPRGAKGRRGGKGKAKGKGGKA